MNTAQTTDIARRVYNHTWKLDPIVRSLLDTDFYKLLMLQMIWGMYPDVDATFSLINRTTSVKLAEEIDEGDLREPVHVHVEKDGIDAKFWLWPDVVVAYNDGFNARALRDLIDAAL